MTAQKTAYEELLAEQQRIEEIYGAALTMREFITELSELIRAHLNWPEPFQYEVVEIVGDEGKCEAVIEVPLGPRKVRAPLKVQHEDGSILWEVTCSSQTTPLRLPVRPGDAPHLAEIAENFKKSIFEALQPGARRRS